MIFHIVWRLPFFKQQVRLLKQPKHNHTYAIVMNMFYKVHETQFTSKVSL